jgi:Malate/L-lactate dehydrogenase
MQGCRSIRRRVAQCRSYRPRRRLGGDGSSGRTGIGSLRQRRGLGAGSAIWGVERRLSTAPYCVGIPRQGQRPIVLDFATSIVAEGKVLVASRGGKKLPKGALIDLEGTLSEGPAVLHGPHSAEEPREPQSGQGRDPHLRRGLGSGVHLRTTRRRVDRHRRHRAEPALRQRHVRCLCRSQGSRYQQFLRWRDFALRHLFQGYQTGRGHRCRARASPKPPP